MMNLGDAVGGATRFAIGVGATLLSKMLSLQTWTIYNQEDGSVLAGQFPAEEATKNNVGSNWAEIQTLSRQQAILQFLNGKTPNLSVQSRFYRRDVTDELPTERMKKLEGLIYSTPSTKKPPRLIFSIGDGMGVCMEVVLTGLNSIKYSQPNVLGGVREITFTMELSKYTQFDFDSIEVTDTRYARAAEGDYYESLAADEYGDAMLGVIIRQRHPQQLTLSVGSVVKLPAIEGVRLEPVTAKSVVFQNAFGSKDTPQKLLRQQHFALRSKSAMSNMLKA